MKITPDDRSDTEVLWTYERMIEKTQELWRGYEEHLHLEMDRDHDHPHDLFYSFMGGITNLLWVG